MDEKVDVVVIGSGVSGLLACSLLSRLGKKVLLLERHNIVGGYLQGFERKGFVFDSAIHWLNQYNDEGTITQVFSMLGKDYPKPQPMKRIQNHITSSHRYLLSSNPEELKNQLIEDFPHEKDGIERFFKVARKIAAVSKKFNQFFQSVETKAWYEMPFFRMKQLSIIYPLIPYALHSGDEGIKKGLSKFFTDPNLQDLFCTERDLLSCLFPIAWAYNGDYQNPPIGGSQVIPKWLQTQINPDLAEIRLSCDVTRFEWEGDKISGVYFTHRAKEQLVKTDYVIAACDAPFLYQQLVPQQHVPRDFFKKLEEAELYSSSVTLSIALDCPAEDLGFGHELTLICEEGISRDEHSAGNPHTAAISVLAPSVRDKSLCPPSTGTLTVYVPAWIDYEQEWQTTKNSKGQYVRTDAYKALKQQFAEIVLDRVCANMCVDLRKHILFMEIATPITYHRYTRNFQGTMMGARPGKKNMQSKIAHYQTPVSNLIIGSQWAELGGGVPIAVKSGFNASLMVLKKSDPTKFRTLLNAFKHKLPI
jgi:prolycopene isomerase